MKCLGFALLAMATAVAASPRAIADPVMGSEIAAGTDVAMLNASGIAPAGQVTWNGYTYTDAGNMELSEVQGDLAGTSVNEVSTVTGSGLVKTPGRQPALRAVGGGIGGSRQSGSQGAPAAPDLSGLVLLGTGLLFLAFLVFRKAKSSAVTVQ